jgi:hypothetical protein
MQRALLCPKAEAQWFIQLRHPPNRYLFLLCHRKEKRVMDSELHRPELRESKNVLYSETSQPAVPVRTLRMGKGFPINRFWTDIKAVEEFSMVGNHFDFATSKTEQKG